MTNHTEQDELLLVSLLKDLGRGTRAPAMHNVVCFGPSDTLEKSIAIGPLRAAFANCWERRFGQAVPIRGLRALFEPPIPRPTVLAFLSLDDAQRGDELTAAINDLFDHLSERLYKVATRFPSSLREQTQPSLAEN